MRKKQISGHVDFVIRLGRLTPSFVGRNGEKMEGHPCIVARDVPQVWKCDDSVTSFASYGMSPSMVAVCMRYHRKGGFAPRIKL